MKLDSNGQDMVRNFCGNRTPELRPKYRRFGHVADVPVPIPNNIPADRGAPWALRGNST